MTKIDFKKYISCSDEEEKRLQELYNTCDSKGLLDGFSVKGFVDYYHGCDDDEIVLKLIYHFKQLISGDFEVSVFRHPYIKKLDPTPEVEVFLMRNKNDYKYTVTIDGSVIDEDLVELYLEHGINPCIDILKKEIGEC